MKILKTGAFLALLMCVACTKPTQNIKIVVDTNIIKYTVLFHITDATNANNPPAGLTMSVGGQDAAQIYEISGQKTLVVTSGIISLGPGPALTPTTSNPVNFSVMVSAPGYSTITYAVKIDGTQTAQVINISMAKINTTGGSVTIEPLTPVITQPGAVPVTLSFVATCANKPDFELHPSDYIFYRETGSTTGYQYLGYMDKGVFVAQLVVGKSYDFEITYNGANYSVTQQIEQTSYSENIDMGPQVCNIF